LCHFSTEISTKFLSVNTAVAVDTKLFNGKIKADPDAKNVFLKSGCYETIGEFFDSETSKLFLMQLPDTLPGRAPDPDDKTEAGKNVSIMRVISMEFN
jgi:hypothetical protein